MERLKQSHVYLRVQTPLGQDQVVLTEMSASEFVSDVFICDLVMATNRTDVNLEGLIGQNITVVLELDDEEKTGGISSSSISSLSNLSSSGVTKTGLSGLLQKGLSRLQGSSTSTSKNSLQQMLRGRNQNDISFGLFSSMGKGLSGLSKNLGSGVTSKLGGGLSSQFGDKVGSLASSLGKSLSAGSTQGEKPSGFGGNLLGKLSSRLNGDAEGGNQGLLGKLGAGLAGKLGGSQTGIMGYLNGAPLGGGVNPLGGEAGGAGSGGGGITKMLLKGLSKRVGADADAEPVGGILSGLSGKLIDKARGNQFLSNIIDRLGGEEAVKGKAQAIIDKLNTGKLESGLKTILEGDGEQKGLLGKGQDILGKLLGKSNVTSGLGGIFGNGSKDKGIMAGTGLAGALQRGPAPRRPAFGASAFSQKGPIQRDLGRKIKYFHGLVGEISQGASDMVDGSQITFYKARLYPKLWLLKFDRSCRIFQNKTVMEIVSDILNENDISDVQNKVVNAGQAVREYCVQYNESNFDFISRLLEEEGIYYYFIHTEKAHTLVLADEPQAHHPCPHVQDAILETKRSDAHFFNAIQNCELVQRVVPKEQAYREYDFELPSNNLAVKAAGKGKGGRIYEYPGKYDNTGDGMGLATRHIEGKEVPKDMLYGQSTVPFFEPGGYFNLHGHPKSEANRRYVLLQIDHYAKQVFDEKSDTLYHNNFSAFNYSSVPYRPQRKTLKPKIPGTQTAKVTGKDGEEIWTDQYGRVKVKFHWDESDLTDERTSCWVRVAQGWAGNDWGMLFTPRIGQEVVVSFLEGDPDRPLITGSVYNGEKRAPYLPDNPTVSTIKTRSSKDSTGYNEIRFQDLTDQEQLYMHAQRNLDIEVELDKNEVIGANETKVLKSGRRSVIIQGKPYEGRISNGEAMSSDDRLVLEKGSRSVLLNADGGSAKANHSTLLKSGNHTVGVVNGNVVTTIGEGNRVTQLNHGNDVLKVVGDATYGIGKNYSIVVGGDLDIKVTGDIKINGKSITATSLEKTDMSAGTSMSLNAQTSLSADSTGTLSAQANASLTAKCTGLTEIKGAIIKLN